MGIKDVIDAARSCDGYDGMAIFSSGVPLYVDIMDEAYAGRVLCIYTMISSTFGETPGSVALDCGGYKIEIITESVYVVIVRHYGHYHYRSIPDDEVVDVGALCALPSRDCARSEAASLLKGMGF